MSTSSQTTGLSLVKYFRMLSRGGLVISTTESGGSIAIGVSATIPRTHKRTFSRMRTILARRCLLDHAQANLLPSRAGFQC